MSELISNVRHELIALRQNIFFGPTKKLNDLCIGTRAKIYSIDNLIDLKAERLGFLNSADVLFQRIKGAMLKVSDDTGLEVQGKKTLVDDLFNYSRFGNVNYHRTLVVFDDREKELKQHDLGIETRESGEP